MPDKHAKLSASGAKKWLNCPISTTLESEFPDTPSEYAAEGTTAHSLGEMKLKLALGRISRVQYHQLIEGLKTDKEMEEYADDYRDFVMERYNAAKSETTDAIILLEQRLDFSEWAPEGFGTGDAVIVSDKRLEVIDLKYGKGVPISAKDNPQLRLYGLGAAAKFGFLFGINDIHMTIYQPRLDNISTEILTQDELFAWGESIKEKAKAAFMGEGTAVAGKHCDDGFCKARPVCRAYYERNLRAAKFDFKRPNTMTKEEIAEAIDLSEQLVKWSKTVKDYALTKALEGEKFPGFKVVEGRSARCYSDEKAVEKALKNGGYEDIYDVKLRGITDMERYLGKKEFNNILGDYVIKPKGKPTLARSEDKRPALDSAEDDFKNIK